jgi:2-amino-4-hydroxy-6-hydroxymethyldihydropteridine diphosphokinase
MTRVYVSIGSNVEPERHVAYALDALRERFGAVDASPVYRAAAVGFEGEDFLNLVAAFDTALDVEAVDVALDAIETAGGRDRSAGRFAPRTLDLDLLLFGDAVIERGSIRVPRREIIDYAFMLKPLADLAGDMTHPVNGRRFRELLEGADFSDQRCEPV